MDDEQAFFLSFLRLKALVLLAANARTIGSCRRALLPDGTAQIGANRFVLLFAPAQPFIHSVARPAGWKLLVSRATTSAGRAPRNGKDWNGHRRPTTMGGSRRSTANVLEGRSGHDDQQNRRTNQSERRHLIVVLLLVGFCRHRQTMAPTNPIQTNSFIPIHPNSSALLRFTRVKVTPAEEKNHAKGGFNVQDDQPYCCSLSSGIILFAHSLLAEHWNLNHLKAQWCPTLTILLQLLYQTILVCAFNKRQCRTNKQKVLTDRMLLIMGCCCSS